MATKRKFKEVGGSRWYLPWKFWAEGDYLVGTFQQVSTDNYDKPNYHIRVEDFSFDAPKNTNGDLLEAGKVLVLNSCGSLDMKMEDVVEGQVCQFEYNGEVEIKKGKYKNKMAHDVTVMIAEADGSETEAGGAEDLGGEENFGSDL